MAEEISREALLIYLNNIRTLETVIHESEKKRNEIENKISIKELNMLNDIESQKPREPRLRMSNLDSEFNSWHNPAQVKTSGICIIVLGVFSLFLAEYSEIFILVSIAIVIVGIAMIVGAKAMLKRDNMRYTDYNRELEFYESKLADFNASKNRVYDKIAEIRRRSNERLTDMTNEKNELTTLLEQSYSANIIPLQFRNIQGIYYLYDYLSTSNQSLSSALMQCNLDAIKQKLDEMINLQSKAIIQQAQANAMLYEQNQQILEAAIATMNNTAVTAQYSKILAVNSELALIMQSEQLAYQQIDLNGLI